MLRQMRRSTGYLMKSSTTEEMVEAVRLVSSGKIYLDDDLPINLSQSTLAENDPIDVLTKREFQIFSSLAEGMSVAEIAQAMSISPKTVGVHQTNLMKKLNLKNSAELTRLAFQSGIIVA